MKLGDLITARIEQLRPAKVQIIPKRKVIGLVANIFCGQDNQLFHKEYIKIAKMLKQYTPTEATRIYLGCEQEQDFKKCFMTNIKRYNEFKDKKLKQNKLIK